MISKTSQRRLARQKWNLVLRCTEVKYDGANNVVLFVPAKP